MSELAPSDDDVFAHFHDVHIDRDNIEHYRGLMSGRLLINQCRDCARWVYPHRPLCPQCRSWNVRPTEVSGRGTLYMYTVIYQSRDVNAPLQQPVVTAAIELNEQKGLRYLARIVHCPHEALRVDMPVKLTWIQEQGRIWPAFEPAFERE